MLFQRLLTALCAQPIELRPNPNGIGIGPEHRQFIHGIVEHSRSERPATGKTYAPRDYHHQPISALGINEWRKAHDLAPIYSYDAATNVATLDIKGPLVHHASLFELECMGVASYDQINHALQEIPERHKNLTAVVLDIASPGGMSKGSQATADFVHQLAQQVPVLAYTDDMMCSAAMKIAAPATEIHASSDADVGSIGTIIAFLDDSKYLEKMGLTWEVFASDDLKSLGHGPLTEAHRAHLQEIVNTNGAKFKSWMTTHRPGLTEDNMRGQSFTASEAPEALLDGHDLPTLAHAQAYAAERWKRK